MWLTVHAKIRCIRHNIMIIDSRALFIVAPKSFRRLLAIKSTLSDSDCAKRRNFSKLFENVKTVCCQRYLKTTCRSKRHVCHILDLLMLCLMYVLFVRLYQIKKKRPKKKKCDEQKLGLTTKSPFFKKDFDYNEKEICQITVSS